jgi:hypothetical protein
MLAGRSLGGGSGGNIREVSYSNMIDRGCAALYVVLLCSVLFFLRII